MARKESDRQLDLDPLKGRLTHHPFAALREKVESTEAKTADEARAKASPPDEALPTEVARGSRRAQESKAGPASKAASGSGAALASSDARGSKSAGTGPTQERVAVRIERTGRGGKTVTIADGPGLAEHALEPLAREIARGMGIGARVEGAEIVVQGDQRERLVGWLGARGFGNVKAGN